MSDYLSFVYGGLSQPSGDAREDGEELARRCLRELGGVDKTRFPPRLLILLASPAYRDREKAEQLLGGIHQTFGSAHENVELIGSSVGGVFFGGRVHPEGALLVCLASNLIEARVSYGKNARLSRKHAVKEVLRDLNFTRSDKVDPNPLANKLLLTFLPGCKEGHRGQRFYPAPELHRLLYEGMRARVWMVGGVSSVNDYTRRTDGWQFAGREVLRDAVVAASIVTGVPIGVSLNDMFDETDPQILRATEVDCRDRRTVMRFNDGVAQQEVDVRGGVMLAKMLAEAERIVDIPLPKPGGAMQLLRPVREGDHFRLLRPGKEIFETVRKGLDQARHRVYVKNPVATLLFPCKAYYPRDEERLRDVEAALARVEEEFGSADSLPCVGGFFDGELGVDETGRSRLTNGGVAYVVLGDELRERTPLYRGVSALAKHGPQLLAGSSQTAKSMSVDDTIEHALEVVKQAGFPSAMLSLLIYSLDRATHTDRAFTIAHRTANSRFNEIVPDPQRPCDEDDILALVAKPDKVEPCFISDSREEDYWDTDAVMKSGIVSQYILPLKWTYGENSYTFGTLQVDVGDLSHLEPSEFRETEKSRVLDCLAVVFSAAILNVTGYIESHIKSILDEAFYKSLRIEDPDKALKQFFRAAGKAFGVRTGLLRLVKLSQRTGTPPDDPTLILETGFGPWYWADKNRRREIRGSDPTPLGCAVSEPDPVVAHDEIVLEERDLDAHRAYAKAPQVVNDVSDDPAWRAVLEGVPPDSIQSGRLKQIESYAAIAFKGTDNRVLGSFGFGSARSWYFMKFHKRALNMLAGRVSFLIEHITARFQRDFLFKVSSELAKHDLDDAAKVLRDVTETFLNAVNAQVVSLYLWDADRGRYFLRAQSGWGQKDDWVGAANYGLGDRWIGVTAIDKGPFHELDLRAHYLKCGHTYPQGRYAVPMFGEPMSDTFRVEAIALPLPIRPETKDRLGVLILYRAIAADAPSGFKTTDTTLLQQGADRAASRISEVLRRNDDMWDRSEYERRGEVYQGINMEDEETFEVRICREVLKAYRATEVDFYRIDRLPADAEGYRSDEPEVGLVHTWIAGCRRRPGSDPGQWEKLRRPSADHSVLIEETRRVNDGKLTYEVAERRHRSPEGGEDDPSAARLSGLVEQVCIPLLDDQTYLAALVIRWTLSPRVALTAEVQHNAEHLQRLGYLLGSTYLSRHFKRKADERLAGLHTAGIYVFQHAHKLGNALVTLYRLSQEVAAAEEGEVLKAKAKELEDAAREKMERIEWVIDLADLIQNPPREPRSLYDLVEESRRDVGVSGYRVTLSDPDEFRRIAVNATPTLVKEVFINLIDNAFKGMKKKEWGGDETPELKVHAVVSEDKETVEITFQDNGVGMSDEQIKAAEAGFVPTKQKSVGARPHKGVGVMISRYLLQVQDGSLRYDLQNTAPGVGTAAIVTLPHCALPQREE